MPDSTPPADDQAAIPNCGCADAERTYAELASYTDQIGAERDVLSGLLRGMARRASELRVERIAELAVADAEITRLQEEIATLRGEKPQAAAVVDRMRAHAGEIAQLRAALDLSWIGQAEAEAKVAAARALAEDAMKLPTLDDPRPADDRISPRKLLAVLNGPAEAPTETGDHTQILADLAPILSDALDDIRALVGMPADTSEPWMVVDAVRRLVGPAEAAEPATSSGIRFDEHVETTVSADGERFAGWAAAEAGAQPATTDWHSIGTWERHNVGGLYGAVEYAWACTCGARGHHHLTREARDTAASKHSTEMAGSVSTKPAAPVPPVAVDVAWADGWWRTVVHLPGGPDLSPVTCWGSRELAEVERDQVRAALAGTATTTEETRDGG